MTSKTKHPAGTTHTYNSDSYKVGIIVEYWEYGEWVSCDNAWEIDDWLEELTPVNPEDVEVLPFERKKFITIDRHEWVVKQEKFEEFKRWFINEFEDFDFSDTEVTHKDNGLIHIRYEEFI